jgi:hypothetical protein
MLCPVLTCAPVERVKDTVIMYCGGIVGRCYGVLVYEAAVFVKDPVPTLGTGLAEVGGR